MSASHSKVVVDHEGDLSSSQKPVLFLGFLFLETDLLLELGILNDLVQRRSNLRVHHFKCWKNLSRNGSRGLQFLQSINLLHFDDCEEWFYILLGSLPSARRAIVCILFSLEQSQVVEWVVAGVLLCLTWESNASNFDFSQLLLRRRNVSPKQFSRTALCVFLSTRWLTTFCTIRWRTIVQVSLGGVHAFSHGPF